MKTEEKKIRSTRIYDGKILALDVDEVELPDGKPAKRECVRHSGGAAALFIKDGRIALVKQFRYLYGKEIYEIPAGKLNQGEDPKVSALRELEEETGYRASDARLFAVIYPTPGYTDEIIHVYFVEDAEYVGNRLDEGEFLNCYFIDIKEVEKMIDGGEITDSKTIVAVYKYLLGK
ncbi:MAG: NUDIX domain-containing protein [Candidatus Coproplasma sp.]